MQSRDNASAARSCLFLLAVAAAMLLLVCVLVALRVAPGNILPDAPTRPAEQRATITPGESVVFAVLDVGQGTCVVLVTPDGRSLVADAGRSGERIERVVVPYLRSLGITTIDYFVATNPDQDHIGGAARLLELMPVRNWVDPVVPTTNQSYARALELVDERGVTALRARRGMTLDLGPRVGARVLWPVDPLLLDGNDPSHNDNSVVVQITHGDTRFLITGDIEAAAEERLVALDTDGSLASNVVVIPHHGSRTSTSADFLDAVSPNVALISAGLDNQYGHPHDEVVQRLRFRSIAVYRTDLDGSIEIRSDGNTYQTIVLGSEAVP